MTRQMKRRQRIYGILLLIICIVIVAMAAQGSTPEEQNVTVVLFLAPLGISLIRSKKKWLYDFPTNHCTSKANMNIDYIGGVSDGSSTANKISVHPHMGGS